MNGYALLAALAGYVAAAGAVGWSLLRTYGHKDERSSLVNTTIKVFIILGYIQCMGMIILVPAGAQVDSFPKVKEHFSRRQLCKTMYAILGTYVIIIMPCLAVIYSQAGEVSTKEERANRLGKQANTHWRSYFSKMCTQTGSTICKKVLPIWVLSISFLYCLFLFTYQHFRKISLSLNADGCALWYPYLAETNRRKLLSLNLRTKENCQNVGEENIRIDYTINFNDYVVMCVSLMGSIVFAIYGGVGLVSLPLGLLSSAVSLCGGGEANQAANAAIASNTGNVVEANRGADERREALFKRELTRINTKAEELIQVTQEVERNREEAQKSNFFISFLQSIQYRREKRILNNMVHRLEVHYERSVHRHNKQRSVVSSVGLFLLGFSSLLASITIIAHICLCILRGAARRGKLLRDWLLHWDAAQQLLTRKYSLSLSLLIYPLVTSYLLVCAFSGISFICHKLKLGHLLALERKRTHLDTLLLNTCLLMFLSTGVALISLKFFPAYAKQPYAFAFYDLALKNLISIGDLYARSGLLYPILVASVLALLLFFVPEKSGLLSVFMPATFRGILNQRGKANPRVGPGVGRAVDSDSELDGQLDADLESNAASRCAGKVPTRNEKRFK
ncbi:LMBR1 domain-containing protein, putative [Plasmodium vivax]|uniref:LMBR1 domain-containing protein, putative n=1 Tax=Plasmodium vivax TaxID=5855 RepID=A0A564ZXF9_PLAVI|nr:LMBR1 domain-containing protein, putative [Plasmodium vivax]